MDEDVDVIWMQDKFRHLLLAAERPRFDAIMNRLAREEPPEDPVAAAIDRQTARLNELFRPQIVIRDREEKAQRGGLWRWLTKEQRP